MRKLSKQQRSTLHHIEKNLEMCFQRTWGVLPPIDKRNEAMYHIQMARKVINEMLSEPEQIEMEEILNDTSRDN